MKISFKDFNQSKDIYIYIYIFNIVSLIQDAGGLTKPSELSTNILILELILAYSATVTWSMEKLWKKPPKQPAARMQV